MSSPPPPFAPPPPPVLSPDGRWWWDGVRWRPVEPTAAHIGGPASYGLQGNIAGPFRKQASAGARFVAWLVDSLLVTIVAVVLILIAHAYEQIDATTTVNGFYVRGSQTTYVLTAVGYLVMSVVVISYFALQWRIAGATLGQRMLRLRVLDRATGQHLSWGRALIRALWFGGSTLIAILSPALGLLAGLVALIGIAIGFGSSGQGLQDRTAQSVVVGEQRTRS